MPGDDCPETLEEARLVIARLEEVVAYQSKRIEVLESEKIQNKSLSFLQRMLGFEKKSYEDSGAFSEKTLILKSGIFDENFYLSEIESVKGKGFSVDDPLQHYLKFGAYEGIDPSSEFDSDWYLDTNPDVKVSGVNPLVHYIKHGRHEGRLPYHGAQVQPSVCIPVSASGFNRKMWSGFQHIGWAELESRADRLFDSQSAWLLAAWLFAHGDIEGAQERVEQSIALAPSSPGRTALVGLMKCYSLLGERGAIQSLLGEADHAERLGSTLPYIRANALCGVGKPEARLNAINEIFYRSGLDAVVLKDQNRSLALDNLASSSIPQGIDDLMPAVEKPLVSVVIPVFNAGATLHIALDGLLQQTCRSLEIIIVDDGSSDNTEEIARAYAERDPRILYFANATNMGAYPSRNEGMKRARGEYVTVHDSDDWSHPQKVERQLQPLLNDSSKVASFSSWVRVLKDLTFVGPWLLNETFVEKNHSSALIRRSALDVTGYWDNVNVAADTEFLWRLEHHYGHQAIVHVLPSTPLSFALSDDSTLTRTKATHVKTIHYGLRRIYREAARWWHRRTENKPVTGRDGARPFPLPLGIARGTPREFDCMLVADFAVQGEKLHRTLAGVRAQLEEGKNLCLFHWPDYQGWHGAAIADEVFALCHEYGIGFAHVGLSISAPVVVMLDEALWQYPPTQGVQVEALERLENGNGGLCEQQEELITYFRDGGIDTVIEEKVV